MILGAVVHSYGWISMGRSLQQTGQQQHQAAEALGIQEGIRGDGAARGLLLLRLVVVAVWREPVVVMLLPVIVVCLHLCAPATHPKTLVASSTYAASCR
jgi:hypothetical protein